MRGEEHTEKCDETEGSGRSCPENTQTKREERGEADCLTFDKARQGAFICKCDTDSTSTVRHEGKLRRKENGTHPHHN